MTAKSESDGSSPDDTDSSDAEELDEVTDESTREESREPDPVQYISLEPTAEPDPFDNVVQACMVDRSNPNPHVAPPRCFSSLQTVSEDDVRAYKKQHPDKFRALGLRIASALDKLHENDSYRAVGLYAALLTQNIDLFELAEDDPMTTGRSGEVCQRLGAVIKQGMRANGERARKNTPTLWYIIIIVIAGLVLAVVIALLAIAVYKLAFTNR